jgi:hypothetical protein
MNVARRSTPVLLGFALLVVVACGGADNAEVIGGGPAARRPEAAEADGALPETEDLANQPPHALGTIVLGEIRESGQSTSSPVVSASFVPDARQIVMCTQTFEGCELSTLPKCNESLNPSGCTEGRACAWDDACKPACKTIPQCSEPCSHDETCVTDVTKPSNPGTCKKRETFDAGPIAFSGTTTPLTLYPPYAFHSDGKGAPFLAGSEIRVQAQGATGAGLEAFDETFTATTFMQTTPALQDIPRDQVFGVGPLTIAWAPGKDTVTVFVSGGSGSAICKGPDSAGKLVVARSVIDRVFGTEPTATNERLSVSVVRQRTETRKGKKTRGSLSESHVQPTAWLDLMTSSMETAVFEGCSRGLTACGDACVDTKTSAANCGGCGKACAGTCSAGACTAGCAAGPENTLARCSDGCSNDGDPYVDCNDYDCCPFRTDCPATTTCGKPK